MKIALVKYRCSLRHGGSEKYCTLLARGLTARGHDVTVIGHSLDDELCGDIQFVRVRVSQLTSWTKNHSFAVNAGAAATAGNYDVVYALGRAFGADIVHVMERIQSHWVNVFYQPKAHSLIQRLNPRHRTLIELERTIYNNPAVQTIVTQSELDRRLLRQYYGIPNPKIRTVHNGADQLHFNLSARQHRDDVRNELNISSSAPLLAFAARDFRRKGLGQVLEAVARCRRTELQLLVIGDGDIATFSAKAESLGLKDQVHFVGRRRDINRYFGACDLFVFPAQYEPFPTVVIEALACGVPTITTPDNGAADFIDQDKTGYLVPNDSKSVAAIANAINFHFAQSGQVRALMQARCSERVKHLTMERVIDETEQLLFEVARQQSSKKGR